MLRDCLCFTVKMRHTKVSFYIGVLAGENYRALYSLIQVEFRESTGIFISLSCKAISTIILSSLPALFLYS